MRLYRFYDFLRMAVIAIAALAAANIVISHPAVAAEESEIRLTRKQRPLLFGSATKMTERDVYEFVANAKISCTAQSKAIFKKEGIDNAKLKARQNLYLSLMEGLTTLSKLSPTLTNRLLLRMKAYPLGYNCASAIKKTPEDLYETIVTARLTGQLRGGRDEMGYTYSAKEIIRTCVSGSWHPKSDDCNLCGRTYVSEADGKISVSANWEDRIASKETCEYIDRTQSSFLEK